VQPSGRIICVLCICLRISNRFGVVEPNDFCPEFAVCVDILDSVKKKE
jgi:hypothetical protein